MKQPLLLNLFFLLGYIAHAQTDHSVQFVAKAYAGAGAALPKNSFCYQAGAGFSAFKNMSSAFYAETGIGIHFQQLPDYRNSSVFRSSWTNGEYESYVNKSAEIRQVMIRVPVNFFYRLDKVSVGLGLLLDYLVASSLSQRVSGTYSNPGYPGSEDPLTSSIRFVYTIDNDQSLNNFVRTNISPQVLLGVNAGKKMQVMLSLACPVFENPVYSNRVVPYRLLTGSVNIYFKL